MTWSADYAHPQLKLSRPDQKFGSSQVRKKMLIANDGRQPVDKMRHNPTPLGHLHQFCHSSANKEVEFLSNLKARNLLKHFQGIFRK